MADTIYRVSLAGLGFRSIQDAVSAAAIDIDNLYANQIPIDGNFIINVEDGIYAGFKILDGATNGLAGTPYRLIIKSADASAYIPVIDFNRSFSFNQLYESTIAGADIGNFNPNVSIESLRFQYFPIGIRAVSNCHNIKINKCVLANNRNAGIFVDNCENVQMLQNVVTNGDYGLIARLCKNIAIIHNTVFLNGSISNSPGKAQAAIWAQLAYDIGGGVGDTGKLHILGNIAWNTVGATLSLLRDDVERQAIISNYNDFIVGSDKFITIETRNIASAGGALQQTFIPNISRWKAIGFDDNSISEDPRFISPIVASAGRSRHIIDLTLFSDSPAKGIVPSFANDLDATATWLPSYVSSSDFSSDILGNNRLSNGTAAGANDAATGSGFFGSDVLASPIESGDNVDCGSEPLDEIKNKNLDLWFPKYKAGYFYSRDREYYLYAKKECRYIGELAVTKFIMPYRIDTKSPIYVKVNGREIDYLSYLDIVGDEIYLYHKDLTISTGDEELEIRYSIVQIEGGPARPYSRRKPNVSIDALLELKTRETYSIFKIKDGQTRYFLPKNYVAKGPVVVTDDSSYPTNPSFVTNREFAVSWNNKFQQAEIVFERNSNLVSNSNFEYSSNSLPMAWTASGVSIQSGVTPNYSIAGSTVCSLNWSGYIQQTFPITSGNSALSWYAYSPVQARGDVSLLFFDGHNRNLGHYSNQRFNTTTSWNRFFIKIGQENNSTGITGLGGYSQIELNRVDVPTNAKSVEISFHSNITGSILIDAVQFEHVDYPSYYHRSPYGFEMTVEFETSEDEYFIDYGKPMSSVVTTQNEGFLYIPEISAAAFDGPLNSSVTTLHEWKWPQGRKYILPWARTAGKDKLRKRPATRMHPHPQDTDYPIVPVIATPEVSAVELIPDVIIASQEDRNGVCFTISASDSLNNPFSDAYFTAWIIDARQRFPGWLFKKFYGAKEQLGQTVYGKLDNAGTCSLTWIPPSRNDVTIITNVPRPITKTTNGQNISIIKTKYAVSPEFNGNVVILNEQNNVINVETSITYGNYRCSFTDNQSIVTTEYPVKPGTIRVLLDNIELKETFISTPDSDQFYADYANGLIIVKGKVELLYIEYIPCYTFMDRTDPYKILVYHDKVFGTYEGQITVCHDTISTLYVDLLDYSLGLYKEYKFDLLTSNGLLNNSKLINKAYLEI